MMVPTLETDAAELDGTSSVETGGSSSVAEMGHTVV